MRPAHLGPQPSIRLHLWCVQCHPPTNPTTPKHHWPWTRMHYAATRRFSVSMIKPGRPFLLHLPRRIRPRQLYTLHWVWRLLVPCCRHHHLRGPPTEDVTPFGQSLGLSKRVSLSLPDVSAVGLSTNPPPFPHQPKATFTLTAAGLCAAEAQPPVTQMDFRPCCLQLYLLCWLPDFSRHFADFPNKKCLWHNRDRK